MKLNTNVNIEIFRSAHVDYELLTSEIHYLREPIAQINKDKGKDAMEIQLFVDFNDPEFIVKFPLDDFIEALKLAKKTLL